MTGFEPRTSGIGSDHSTNWATTTAPISQQIFVQYNWVQWRELYKRYNASECKTSNVQFSLVNTDRLSYKSFNCFFHVEINFIFSLSITHSLSLSLSLSFFWKMKVAFLWQSHKFICLSSYPTIYAIAIIIVVVVREIFLRLWTPKFLAVSFSLHQKLEFLSRKNRHNHHH